MEKRSDIPQVEGDLVAALMAQVADMRARMDTMARDNEALSRELAELSRESSETISELRGKLDEQQAEIARLLEQIRLANCRFFGSKSEKVVPEQLSLFNDMDAAADPSAAEPSIADALEPAAKKQHRRGGKRRIDLSSFETIVIEHDLPEDGRACPECGHELEEIGYDVVRRLRLIPARFVVEEHRTKKYRCRPCCDTNADGGEDRAVIVRAASPRNCLERSIATPSLVSHVIHAKYCNAMPLYRIEGDFAQIGLRISRQNMANWVVNVHARWLHRVHERIRSELLSHDLIHADETEVQVLREPGRDARSKSRCWLFCSAECDTPAYVYVYDATRAKSVAEGFLRGWSGTLTTDGYDSYYTLDNGGDITNVSCMVHIRRKYVDVVKSAGDEERAEMAGSVALEGRRMIDAIFHADSAFDGMSPDDRKAGRQERLKPMMEAFARWVEAQIPNAVPRSALHKALLYSRKYWPYAMNVLDDGRLALSNNIAERGIKPFVIGRKNWLFSDTPRGAAASAAIYSIVTTARMNGLSPRAYIEWLLEELPNAGELDDETVDRFMPWSPEVPERLMITKDAAERLAATIEEPIMDIDPDMLSKDR